MKMRLRIKNKQPAAINPMLLREIPSVKLRVRIIKHGVSRSCFHGGTRRENLQLLYPVYFALLICVICVFCVL